MNNIPENLPDEALVAVDPCDLRPAEVADKPHAHAGLVRLGPSRLHAIWILFFSPFAWLALLLGTFAHSAHFRAGLYNLMSGMPDIQRGMIEFYIWQQDRQVPIWVWPALIVLGYMAVRITTTHYHLTDDGILTVKHGLLSLKSPAGPFAQYVDAIPMGLVLDVDLRRGITEMLIGTGTLALRSREAAKGGSVSLHHVPKAETARNLLMGHSPARDARVIVSG